MSRWTILDGVEPGTPEDLKLKLQIQYVSDAYKSMQSRLDGYRNSAGAIFLAVVASSLTFDSTFTRLLVDPSSLGALRSDPNHVPLKVVVGAGVLVVVIGLVSLLILHRIGEYFAEMTSIVYKIDAANEAWTPGRFIEGVPLYPFNFQLPPGDPYRHDVARDLADRPLQGWRDPAIKMYFLITAVITAMHIALYSWIAAILD